jgi:hypothetical protein
MDTTNVKCKSQTMKGLHGLKPFLKHEARAQGHTNKDREGRARCFAQSAFNPNMQVKRLSSDVVPMQVNI